MKDKNPLFLRFINRETSVSEMLSSFARSSDSKTAVAASKLINSPPDLEDFRSELEEAVTDIIKEGVGEEFKSFVNHYMESSLEEDLDVENTSRGQNISHQARVKDDTAPWIQGFLCYNLCLYIKAFGMDDLKKCRVCGKLFANKGKWAVYCGDECKKKKTEPQNSQPQQPKSHNSGWKWV